MRNVIMLCLAILLSIGLISSLNGNEYIGLSGILQRLSNLDLSFSKTLSVIMDCFNSFKAIGSSNSVLEGIKLALDGLLSFCYAPVAMLLEVIKFIRSLFELLFALVGVF